MYRYIDIYKLFLFPSNMKLIFNSGPSYVLLPMTRTLILAFYKARLMATEQTTQISLSRLPRP